MKYQPNENPAGTNGFAFLEFASSNPSELHKLFDLMGFTHIANHKSKEIELWKQNDITFLINNEKNGFAENFANSHNAGACGMGFLVNDMNHAYNHCIKNGAVPKQSDNWQNTSDTKVINGIADTCLYLTECTDLLNSGLFTVIPGALEKANSHSAGLLYIDHLTHNVFRGNMDKWAKFYEDLFNFKEIRYFDIEGKLTGLVSRAMTAPCLKIKIPINESSDNISQIEEFLKLYNGEGIQHIALESENIFESVEKLRGIGMKFMKTPDSYYKNTHKRLPYHPESVERMQKNQILIDGAPTEDGGYLLQIFTDTVIGPVFFEIIQRKGDDGFGEGNFQALFDSIENDQLERGVISAK
jgi:4-hydroxyphenylpyruvate dioxygenase